MPTAHHRLHGLRQLLSRHTITVVVVMFSVILWGALSSFAPAWVNQMDDRSTDWVWRVSAVHTDERRLIVVDIDERSLQEIGPWPWSRSVQARLIKHIADAGAGQQILDVVFADPKPDDNTLAQQISRQGAVLAQLFALAGQGESTRSGQLSGALDWAGCSLPFAQSVGYLANTPALGSAAPVVGHITPTLVQDGVVRQQPAIICHEGKAYPALTLAAMMRGASEPSLLLRRGTGWLDAPWYLLGARQALPPVPLDERGDMRVPWHIHPNSFISISAADMLANRVPAGLLDKAWVLVGSSAFGLNDTVATPFHPAAAGMQAHAELLVGMLDGRLPYRPNAALWIQGLATALGLAMLAWLGREPRRPIYLLPMAALGWVLATCLLHGLLLITVQIWIGWVQSGVVLGLTGLLWGALSHAQSRLDRERLYTHLSSYLPAPVAAALALQPPSSAIKAGTRQVSVLFADIRNFSAYCEARPPEEAAAVLHTFFSAATRVVEAHGGVIEAFQGDAILAVWNGAETPVNPTDSPQHARQALQAAVHLLTAMDGVLPDPAPAGLEPLALGIGVESGPAMTGSFGLASRRTHMVMGRTVTIASRLVDMTADLAHPILVGEGMAAHLGGGAGLQSMGTFLLDGMRVPHHVYAPPLILSPRLP